MGQSVPVAKLAPDLEDEALTKILLDISRRLSRTPKRRA
jgi:hypothetical protein